MQLIFRVDNKPIKQWSVEIKITSLTDGLSAFFILTALIVLIAINSLTR